ncbi:MAG: hypothetical protein IT307_03890 [Chloroflexi bacterium]|nr:hypothetical protein [Chloroflexota bacterium]
MVFRSRWLALRVAVLLGLLATLVAGLASPPPRALSYARGALLSDPASTPTATLVLPAGDANPYTVQIIGTVVALDTFSVPARVLLRTVSGDVIVYVSDLTLLPLLGFGQNVTVFGTWVAPNTEFNATRVVNNLVTPTVGLDLGAPFAAYPTATLYVPFSTGSSSSDNDNNNDSNDNNNDSNDNGSDGNSNDNSNPDNVCGENNDNDLTCVTPTPIATDTATPTATATATVTGTPPTATPTSTPSDTPTATPTGTPPTATPTPTATATGTATATSTVTATPTVTNTPGKTTLGGRGGTTQQEPSSGGTAQPKSSSDGGESEQRPKLRGRR